MKRIIVLAVVVGVILGAASVWAAGAPEAAKRVEAMEPYWRAIGVQVRSSRWISEPS